MARTSIRIGGIPPELRRSSISRTDGDHDGCCHTVATSHDQQSVLRSDRGCRKGSGFVLGNIHSGALCRCAVHRRWSLVNSVPRSSGAMVLGAVPACLSHVRWPTCSSAQQQDDGAGRHILDHCRGGFPGLIPPAQSVAHDLIPFPDVRAPSESVRCLQRHPRCSQLRQGADRVGRAFC